MNGIRVTFEGNLGRDAVVRETSDGQPVVNLSVPTDHWNRKARKTVWMQVSAFGDRWAKLAPHLTTGRQVVVIGRLTIGTYVNEKNITTPSYDVVADDIILGARPQSNNTPSPDDTQPNARVADDDLPL